MISFIRVKPGRKAGFFNGLAVVFVLPKPSEKSRPELKLGSALLQGSAVDWPAELGFGILV